MTAILEPTIRPIDRSVPFDAKRRAEMLAGAFLAGYSNLSTRGSHAQTLREFFAFLDSIEPDLDLVMGVKRHHIDLYARWLDERNLLAATVSRKLSTLASFYGYLCGEDHATHNPTLNVKRPKIPRESTRDFLTPRELADFLAAAEHAGGHTNALCCLLAFNGLRVNEALSADVEDLGEHDYHHTLRIVGKGNQPALIPLHPRTRQAIGAAIVGREDGPLLLNKSGTRMDRQSAGRIVARLARPIVKGKNITPHSLRHSAVTAYLKSGATLDQAAQFARHLDQRTTSRYDRRTRSLDEHGTYALTNFIGSYQR